MVPCWIELDAALAHNRRVLGDKPASMGLSIGRETWMLAHVLESLAAK